MIWDRRFKRLTCIWVNFVRRRLAIAAGIIAAPSIIFLDEPTSGVCDMCDFTLFSLSLSHLSILFF